MKNIKNIVSKYSYYIEYDSEDKTYISRCAEFPSLKAHGRTQEQSLQEIKIAVSGALKWMKKEKQPYPETQTLA